MKEGFVFIAAVARVAALKGNQQAALVVRAVVQAVSCADHDFFKGLYFRPLVPCCSYVA